MLFRSLRFPFIASRSLSATIKWAAITTHFFAKITVADGIQSKLPCTWWDWTTCKCYNCLLSLMCISSVIYSTLDRSYLKLLNNGDHPLRKWNPGSFGFKGAAAIRSQHLGVEVLSKFLNGSDERFPESLSVPHSVDLLQSRSFPFNIVDFSPFPVLLFLLIRWRSEVTNKIRTSWFMIGDCKN